MAPLRNVMLLVVVGALGLAAAYAVATPHAAATPTRAFSDREVVGGLVALVVLACVALGWDFGDRWGRR